MGDSKIEWTDSTWNPIRGCVKVSPGCKHCYAEAFAERFRGVPGHPYEQGFDLRLVPEKLDAPLRWRDPQMIFVNSMSDLHQEEVPDGYVAAVYGVMAAARNHVFQVLTKRAGRRREFVLREADRFWGGPPSAKWCIFNALCRVKESPQKALLSREALESIDGIPWPLANVWQGVSVEDRKYGVPRIDELRATPAAVRFLSIEPLLEDVGELDLSGIDWVIVGAESGRGARPMRDDWVRSIRDQCVSAGVKFFFKQRATANGKKLSLPLLDGRKWAELPEVP